MYSVTANLQHSKFKYGPKFKLQPKDQLS